MKIRFKRVQRHDPDHVNYQTKINGTPVRVKIQKGAWDERFLDAPSALEQYLKTMLFSEITIAVAK